MTLLGGDEEVQDVRPGWSSSLIVCPIKMHLVSSSCLSWGRLLCAIQFLYYNVQPHHSSETREPAHRQKLWNTEVKQSFLLDCLCQARYPSDDQLTNQLAHRERAPPRWVLDLNFLNNDLECYVFTGILLSSLEKQLLKSFAHFKKWLICLSIAARSLCTLQTVNTHQTHTPRTVCCHFTFMGMPLE